MYFGESIILESYWTSKMPFQFKPYQSLEECFKKGNHPGMINYIKSCSNIDDLNYMKRNINKDIKDYEKIISLIDDYKKGKKLFYDTKKGKKEFESYRLDLFKKEYIDSEFTKYDIMKYSDWLKEVAIKAINEKIKELKS